jgi:hypothetical protein
LKYRDIETQRHGEHREERGQRRKEREKKEVEEGAEKRAEGGAERKAGGGPRALWLCLSEQVARAPRRAVLFARRRQEVGLEKENPPTVCGTTRSRCETDANQACYCTRWYDSGQRIIMVPQPEKRSEASVRVFPTRTTKL